MPISLEDLENWFTYHPPQEARGDLEAYQIIRKEGLRFAQVILNYTPPCADQSAAIRKVRETVWTANAARACHDAPREVPPG